MTIRRVKSIARSSKPIKRSRLKRGKGEKGERETPMLDAFRFAVFDRARGRCEIQSWPGLTNEERRALCGTDEPHEGHNAHHVCPSDRDAGQHQEGRGLYCCWKGHRNIHNPDGVGLLPSPGFSGSWSHEHGLLEKSGWEGTIYDRTGR